MSRSIDFSHRKNRLLLFAIFIYLIGLSTHFAYRQHEDAPASSIVLNSDMEGYYQYLPYFFLKDREEMRHMKYAKNYGSDRKLNVYTCGVAIMQAPFFLIAHGISKAMGLKADGYAPAYFISVVFAGMFYATVGLIFLFMGLSRYFNKQNALLTTALVFFATNLFYYGVISPGMSHVYSFFLVSVFLYAVPKFYTNPTITSAILVAVPFALAILIRPTTIVIGFYFLLYEINSFKLFEKRLKTLAQNAHLLAVMLLISVLIFSPQIAYWYFVTGKWFVYSYQEEGFTNLLSPKIATVLIGKRNGMFLYTPLTFLAVCSLFYLLIKKRFLEVLIPLLIILYLNASWWRPTFGAAAGYRAMVEFYPLLAIPLAYLLEKTFNSTHKMIKVTLIAILVIFVIYNILFTLRYESWYWWDAEWQWSVFLRIIKF